MLKLQLNHDLTIREDEDQYIVSNTIVDLYPTSNHRTSCAANNVILRSKQTPFNKFKINRLALKKQPKV